jgi:hypothetical protein
MIEEATKAGLNFPTTFRYIWGGYVPPGISGEADALHNSMTAAWRLLEYFPKSATYKEWPERKAFLGFYIPDCEPRVIPEGAHVHESVVQRMEQDPTYRPVNLPTTFATVPMPVPPHARGTVEAG